MDNLILCCPVTQENFKDPRFLSCGHTVDLLPLLHMKAKKCPLCNKVFTQDPKTLPINWIVVSLLNLSIKSNIEEETSYTADKARSDYDYFIITNSLAIENTILDLVKKNANSGESFTRISTKKFSLTICENIKKSLLKKGYKVNFYTIPELINWVVEFLV